MPTVGEEREERGRGERRERERKKGFNALLIHFSRASKQEGDKIF
jgi:hypothetical protein